MPVVAAARALRELGHEPLLLVPPSLADRAAQTGLEFALGGEPSPQQVESVWQRLNAGPADAVEYLIERELFGALATDAMLDSALAVCDEFKPDLIVREPCEYASAIVAHRISLPQLRIAISQASIESDLLGHVADTLERRSPGVVERIRMSPCLTPFPESMDPSPWPLTRRFRASQPAARQLPDWWPNDHRLPLVYVTFGSVLGNRPEAGEAYRAALDAVDGLPVRMLLTVGSGPDLGALGSIPANTHVERWVTQQDVLGSATLVVCHGGSGTTFGALNAGLPLVVCPMFSDQAANAALVKDVKAGVVLEPREIADSGFRPLRRVDAASLRQLIVTTLDDSSYREAASRVAQEVAEAPTLSECLEVVTSNYP
jgi:UDP:flavonoid glycosyltransferase YjiC (YdhE family)